MQKEWKNGDTIDDFDDNSDSGSCDSDGSNGNDTIVTIMMTTMGAAVKRGDEGRGRSRRSLIRKYIIPVFQNNKVREIKCVTG